MSARGNGAVIAVGAISVAFLVFGILIHSPALIIASVLVYVGCALVDLYVLSDLSPAGSKSNIGHLFFDIVQKRA